MSLPTHWALPRVRFQIGCVNLLIKFYDLPSLPANFLRRNLLFKLAKDKRQAWLNANADSVIEKLNCGFAQPWFAQKKDGTVVKDLGDPTYEETDLRLVRLMYVKHQSRWIDISLRNLLGDWLRRVEERFASVNGKPKQSILQSYNPLNDPAPFVATFLERYPKACEQLLAAEDKRYFLSIAQRPGQKPAPFIPVLDQSVVQEGVQINS